MCATRGHRGEGVCTACKLDPSPLPLPSTLAATTLTALAAATDLVSSAPSLFRAVHQGVYHGSRRNDDNDDVQRIQRDG